MTCSPHALSAPTSHKLCPCFCLFVLLNFTCALCNLRHCLLYPCRGACGMPCCLGVFGVRRGSCLPSRASCLRNRPATTMQPSCGFLLFLAAPVRVSPFARCALPLAVGPVRRLRVCSFLWRLSFLLASRPVAGACLVLLSQVSVLATWPCFPAPCAYACAGADACFFTSLPFFSFVSRVRGAVSAAL
ncbi:hypothetical protein TRVL_03798 [Trypanosoma vivax]|nr:hypothetical protein TRVL_03798 [Trypanosoma vivax]